MIPMFSPQPTLPCLPVFFAETWFLLSSSFAAPYSYLLDNYYQGRGIGRRRREPISTTILLLPLMHPAWRPP
ncbi:uncharacterized protein LY79DRAFT_39401 [Colletotrichum navitas]|uniref:Uncharacterized protein n=1 Tax=Colletotrichum navitas TaxID=681940 RepID=A0AAD8PNQ8_9PEZI|nr:uncharacterized protein LY79DRAFT_39401 [Colletotrichum navitas]KAK1572990.1 hypothetical protein LY79DRAFT_39401 [Colletotrichum navitas]